MNKILSIIFPSRVEAYKFICIILNNQLSAVLNDGDANYGQMPACQNYCNMVDDLGSVAG